MVRGQLVALLVGSALGLSVKFVSHPLSREATAHQPALSYDASTDSEYQQGVKLRDSGRFSEAAEVFTRVARAEPQEHNLERRAKALLAAGGAQLLNLSYKDAARTYFETLAVAKRLHNFALEGAIQVNLSEIHIQIGDFEAAEREARDAIALLGPGANFDHLSKARMQLGSILLGKGSNKDAIREYRIAVQLAEKAQNAEDNVIARIMLADALIKLPDAAGAERELVEAYRLSVLHHHPALIVTRAKIAELELLKGRPAIALRSLDSVLSSNDPALLAIPRYQILYRRAQMLAALVRNDEALATFREAVKAATLWREQALPGDSANASSVRTLHTLYAEASDFVAELALERNSLSLRRESLEILATNRAADLRDRRTLAWQRSGKLPDSYYRLLDQLRTAQASDILSGASTGAAAREIERIRTELGLLETQISMETQDLPGDQEKFRARKTLVDVQQNLENQDALFSFNLGERRSWMWVLSRHSIELYALPPGRELERASGTLGRNGAGRRAGSRCWTGLLKSGIRVSCSIDPEKTKLDPG